MPYDLFISYAHQGDNTSREAVAALVFAARKPPPGDGPNKFLPQKTAAL